MTTSSEDVLRLFEFVRVKKNDGTLYMMAERIAWMPNGKDTFTISHKYADIKTQKISPEGKPKIQLQIVLHSGSETTTFHFVNPNGVQGQLNDRNEVKELLQQLLPQFKRKLSKEMEEKSRILSEDPSLYQLYKELVISNVITAEEFWSNYAAEKRMEMKNMNDLNNIQSVGVSAAFLADIKPQTDGCNGIKYNITSETIESIFRTYPVVKRKHFENVPHKMSESEFWQRFFQSHYFHRDRNSSSGKDFFSECSKSDEMDIKKAISRGIMDPFVDISSFEDGNFSSLGFGNKPAEDASNRPESSQNSFSSANEALIKRFNHHSIMVLESCLKSRDAPSAPPVVNGTYNKKSPKPPNPPPTTTITPAGEDNDDEIRSQREKYKKIRLSEMTEIEDLVDSDSHATKDCVLKISNRDLYLKGPTPNISCDDVLYSTASNGYNGYNNSNNYNHSNSNQLQSYHQQEYLMSRWQPHCKRSLSSPSAISALSELSPGGALMKSSHTINLKDEVSLDVQKELKHLSFALNELLRHFWSCFPVTSPQLEDKLIQMRSTLERFHYGKLQPFHDRLAREHHPSDLTSHLMHQLQKAYNRFTSWQAKRNILVRK